MPGADALALLSQSLLVVLTAWKLIELLRHRDRARLDLVLVLAPLALAVGVTWLEERGLWAVVDVPLAPMAFVLHPVMLLRVVDHFRAVPRWVAALMVVSVAASWALLALAPAVGTQRAHVVVVALFALGLLYAARSLTRGARHAQGVVRRRMRFVTAGALLIAVVAFLGVVGMLQPTLTSRMDVITQALALLAMAAYALGLAPPSWLSRSWQQADVQQFLRASTGTAGESTDQTLTRLCQTARHAVGGEAAALARWNESRQRLELELRGERALVGGPLPADGLVAREWTFRRPFVAASRKEVHTACRRIAPGLDCDAILGVPLVTPTRVWGLLLVFLRRGPVLPAEDLRLLSLLTEHSAVILDYAALVAQLRRDNAGLRGESPPEEPSFDDE